MINEIQASHNLTEMGAHKPENCRLVGCPTCEPSLTEEKGIYFPEDWARVICRGIESQEGEGDLEGERRAQAEALLSWIKSNYPDVASEFSYLFSH